MQAQIYLREFRVNAPLLKANLPQGTYNNYAISLNPHKEQKYIMLQIYLKEMTLHTLYVLY